MAAPAYDAISNPTQGFTADTSWTHTPTGTPKGVVVAIVCDENSGGAGGDDVVGVTYGGTAMTRVDRASDTATEQGHTYLYFLGSSVPTGAQTVAVDLVASPGPDWAAYCITLTGDGDLEVVASGKVEANTANPSVTLGTVAGFDGIVVCALFSGLGVVGNVTAGSGYTKRGSYDHGAATSHVETGAKSGANVVADWTSSDDDVAMVAAAIATSGTSVALNQATETDVAQPIGKTKAKALAQAASTELAQTIGRLRTIPVGQALETDSVPGAFGRAKARTVAQAVESSLAQPVGRAKARTLAQASSTELAQPVGKTRSRALSQASSTELAQPVARAKAKAAGQALETELAQTIGKARPVALNQASETELAQPVARAKGRALAQALETELAQPVGRAKARSYGQALELDTATAFGKTRARALAQAVSTELAQTIGRAKARALAQALEADTAQALSRAKARTLGQALETDVAQTIAASSASGVALNQALELDTAGAIGKAKARALAQAAELDVAQPVGRAKARALAQIRETAGRDQVHTVDVSVATWGGYFVKPAITSGIADPHGGTAAYRLASADNVSPANYSGLTLTAANAGTTVAVGEVREVRVWLRAVTGTLAMTLGFDDGGGHNTAITIDGTWREYRHLATRGSLNQQRIFELFELVAANTAWEIFLPRSLLVSANPIARSKARALGQALELDTAGAFGKALARGFAQALELDTAQPLARAKAAAFAQALESSLAQTVAAAKARGIGQALELDVAAVLGKTKARALAQALELDEALAFTVTVEATPVLVRFDPPSPAGPLVDDGPASSALGAPSADGPLDDDGPAAATFAAPSPRMLA